MRPRWPGYANVAAVVQFYRYHLPNSQKRLPRPRPCGPVEAVTGGFFWSDTKLGHDFWSEVVLNLGGWGKP